jgi:hypothetical protein
VRSAHRFAGDAHLFAGAGRCEGQHRMTGGDLEVAESSYARERGSRPEAAAGRPATAAKAWTRSLAAVLTAGW